jgi:hypothetical protein
LYPTTSNTSIFQTQNKTIMADAAEPSAPPTEALANLHLDEVTGEKVSKSELKKRQKQRQKEEEKAKKAAAAPPKPVAAKKSNAEADEKELNPNVPSLKYLHCEELRLRRALAIFRDSIPQHQQASTDQEPKPISPQVPYKL